MPATSLEWVTTPERFAAIASEWDRLAEREWHPFLLSRWLEPWWRAYAAPDGVRVAVLWRDGAVAAGLPLWGGRRRWDAPVAYGDPPFYGVLAADDAARRELIDALLRAAPGELRALGLLAEERTLPALLDAAARAGRWTHVEPMPPSLLVDTTGSLEDYRGGLSRRARSELGRLRRKAEREHRAELRPLAVPADLDAELEAALALEASGWKGARGTAVLCRPDAPGFFRDIAARFHATGALRLSSYHVDGALAAMGLGVVHRGRLFTLRVAYDERRRALGPGLVLLMAVIEACFEQGLDAYEFCGNDDEYERRFATGERPRVRLRTYRPALATGLRYLERRSLRPALKGLYAQARERSATSPAARTVVSARDAFVRVRDRRRGDGPRA